MADALGLLSEEEILERPEVQAAIANARSEAAAEFVGRAYRDGMRYGVKLLSESAAETAADQVASINLGRAQNERNMELELEQSEALHAEALTVVAYLLDLRERRIQAGFETEFGRFARERRGKHPREIQAEWRTQLR